MVNKFYQACLLSIGLLFHLQQAYAIDESEDKPRFSVSGFGTIGAVYNNSDQVTFIRDLLQSRGVGHSHRLDFGVDSLIGLQVTATLHDNIDATVQVVSRRAQNEFDPEVTWAFARYSPSENLQLRAGRLGFDAYLLADSRNVAYSYLWVRPPVDYFGALIVSYLDGADLIVKYPIGVGIARIKGFVGKAREKSATGNPGEYFSLNGSKVVGGHLEFQSQSWIYRLGYSQVIFKNEFPGLQPLLDGLRSPAIAALSSKAAVLADTVGFKDNKLNYTSGGIGFDDGPLQAQFMLSRVSSEILGYPGYNAGYFSAGYRLGKWTPYVTYAAARPLSRRNKGDTGLPAGIAPSIDALIAGADTVANSALNEQSTYTVGARYDLADKVDLKIQVDRVNNKQRQLVRNAQPGWDGQATLFSVSVNFMF